MQCFLKLKIEGLQKIIAIFLMILHVATVKYSTPVNVNGIYILGHMNWKQLPKTALVRRMNLQDNVGMNLTNLTANKKKHFDWNIYRKAYIISRFWITWTKFRTCFLHYEVKVNQFLANTVFILYLCKRGFSDVSNQLSFWY